jgi:FdhD protein
MQQSIVRVELKTHILLDFDALERHFYGTSSCGICGKASIDVLQKQCPILPINNFFVKRDFIFNLSKILQEKQVFFQHTGGLHAAFITSPSGVLQLLREDVGRHNALDKVIGAAFQQKLLPLSESVLLMSSRASFELIQKAAMAGISIMACVGAPSSLAIETAKALGLTLIGFLRDESFNIYSGEERIIS